LDPHRSADHGLFWPGAGVCPRLADDENRYSAPLSVRAPDLRDRRLAYRYAMHQVGRLPGVHSPEGVPIAHADPNVHTPLEGIPRFAPSLVFQRRGCLPRPLPGFEISPQSEHVRLIALDPNIAGVAAGGLVKEVPRP